MPSYFPLLPSISSNSLSNEIKSSTTLLNYVNNLKESNQSKIHLNSIYIGTYKLSGLIWELVSIKECKYGEFIDINRNSFNVTVEYKIVGVPIVETVEFVLQRPE